MHTKISKQTKQELLKALRERYGQSSKIEKSKILDGFVAIAECHRKHAIRLLTSDDDSIESNPSAPGRRIYSEAVREALVVLWEAADRAQSLIPRKTIGRTRRDLLASRQLR